MTISRRHLTSLLFSASAWLLFTCGGGTEIGTGRTEIVAGTLHFTSGQPASGAAVRFTPASGIETTTFKPLGKTKGKQYYAFTAADGRIILNDTLDDGYYCAFGGAGTLLSFHDSILFTDGVCQPMSDTLRNPGSLCGTLSMQSAIECQTVLILVPGFPTILPDKNGVFSLAGFPQGTYQIRFLSTLDTYLPYDTTITITAGITDTLQSPVALQYIGPVPVTGLQYTMDTLSRSVTFRWNRPANPHIAGYRIELTVNALPSAFEKIISNVADTQYTHYLQDSVRFRIRTSDCNNDPSGPYSERIHVAAVNLCPIRRITASADSIYATDLAINDDRLYLFTTNQFNQYEHGIRQIDTSGRLLHEMSLYYIVNDPLAFTLSEDTIVLLNRQDSDSLSVHWFLDDSEVRSLSGIPIVAGKDMPPRFEVAATGDLFINTNMTLFRVNQDGLILLSKNRVARPFSIVNSEIFTILTASPYEVIGSNLVFEQHASYPYGIDNAFVSSDAGVNICTFTTNVNGWMCSLIDKSLFVFTTAGAGIARLYLLKGNSVSDMVLTGSNILYILYTDTEIDCLDLNTLAARIHTAAP